MPAPRRPPTRKDALVCAARIIDLVDRMMRARGEDGRGTVGQLLVSPNSRNVIPGEVRFSVEFRHPLDAEVDRLDAQFPREAGFIARDCGVKLELTQLFKIPAQPFDPACVDLVRQGAAKLGYSAREIVSGAGHDAVYVARHVPTAMIFTPCKDGLSHNEAESIEPERSRGWGAGAVRGGAGAGQSGGVSLTRWRSDQGYDLGTKCVDASRPGRNVSGVRQRFRLQRIVGWATE